MSVVLKKDDITKIYDEVDRRLRFDVYDECLTPEEIPAERASMLQGVYSAICSIVPIDNWREIVWWIDDIERERYDMRGDI